MLSCSVFLDWESYTFHIHKDDFSFLQWPALIAQAHVGLINMSLNSVPAFLQHCPPLLLLSLRKLRLGPGNTLEVCFGSMQDCCSHTDTVGLINNLKAIKASTFWFQLNISCKLVPVHLVRTFERRSLNSYRPHCTKKRFPPVWQSTTARSKEVHPATSHCEWFRCAKADDGFLSRTQALEL